MPYYTLNRDLVLASTTGHAVAFKKGVPCNVPPDMAAEVVAIGGEEAEAPPPVEGEEGEPPVDEGVPPPGTGGQPPADQATRDSELKAAIEAITLRNNRDDFTAGNKPSIGALAAELGWTPTATERDIMLANIANGTA